MASLGYCLRSAQWCGPGLSAQAVGLDIGNAYTVVSQVQQQMELATTYAEAQVLNHSL
jgi:molecular chaperone DnaK (HSP70)